MKIVGIDLAGMDKNKTGFCALTCSENKELDKVAKVKLMHTDAEILLAVEQENPDLICIDAPLSAPKEGDMRDCDHELVSYGKLPPLLGGMKSLTNRAIELKRVLESYAIIEIYAKATSKILGYYDEDYVKQQKSLLSMGIRGDLEKRVLSKDEIDSVTAALTGYLYLSGKTKEAGHDSIIIIPGV